MYKQEIVTCIKIPVFLRRIVYEKSACKNYIAFIPVNFL